ncbi:hypothetical protein ACIBL5_06845 [Streptomyces sp. NPDC050516]|uniref:hypothetical protein n=1 Tax=Streptomyces sp. NPDC050516 TaxID=3365621 RepID=UPI00379ACC0A
MVDELYAFIEQNRMALQLVESCAEQLPELAQWYFVQRRRAMVEQVGTYVAARIAAGLLRPVPDVPVSARFIVETVAWFAAALPGGVLPLRVLAVAAQVGCVLFAPMLAAPSSAAGAARRPSPRPRSLPVRCSWPRRCCSARRGWTSRCGWPCSRNAPALQCGDFRCRCLFPCLARIRREPGGSARGRRAGA